MSTLGAIRSRLANEIGNYDLLDQYDHAIRGGIERHEAERFSFNGVRLRLDTVIGQEFYTLPTDLRTAAGVSLAAGENMIEIETAMLRWGTSARELRSTSFDQLEFDNASAGNGQPACWAREGVSFRVGPTPDAIYSIYLIGLGRLKTLTASTDTNAWLTSAPALVIAAAKVVLARDALRNEALMASAVDQESNALSQLRRGSSAARTNRIRPWGY